MSRLGRLLLGSVLLTAACRERVSYSSPDAGLEARSDALAHLREARQLAKSDPAWSAVLAPHSADVYALGRNATSFANKGFADALGGAPMAFGARASSFADGALEVRAGDAGVALRVLGAKSVEGTSVEGDVLYPEVFPSTDFVVGSAPGRIEGFWLLRDAAAPRSFALALDLTGLTARVDGSALALVDSAGHTRMRVPQPYALDANGVRRAATMKLEGSTLTIAIDPTDLAYPILLDPALEQVIWTDLGPAVPAWPPPGGTGFSRITVPGGLARAGGTMRSAEGRVYLFGGSQVFGSYSTLVTPYATQLFEWSAGTWTATLNGDFADALVLGDASKGTTDRVADIAWDPVRKKLVLFGGYSDGASGSHLGLYEYDPVVSQVWTKICADSSACYASMPASAAAPSAPSAVWAFNKAILVHETGTYEWDPAAKLLKKFAATPDLKRAGAALAFDAKRNRLVAYGDSAGGSETWETDGATWTKVLTVGPLGVKNPSLAYHGARKRVVLWASTFTTGGLWTWDGAAWTAVTLSGGGASLRPNAAFTYDDNTGKLVMFGGGDLGAGSAPNCFYNTFVSPFDNNLDFRNCARVDTWTSTLFGGACATTADCGIGTTCVDSVCCQTTCGTCQRCDLAGTVGTCASVTNAEDPGSCEGTSACDATGICRKKRGEACAIGTDCLTGNCADGYCCDSGCPGACESCSRPGLLGTCGPLPLGATGKGCAYYTCSGASGACATSCLTDSACAPNAFCNASSACVVQLGKGAACTRTRQCASGACVDGVCCDSPCGGSCDVCSAALGATADGTCSVLPKTAAPPECAPGRCSGTSAACGSTCTVDGDCAVGAYCTGGSCASARKKGESCERTSQCATGLSCADGVCCNEACDGACKACSALNKESGDKGGECGPAKEGTNPGAKCTKSAVSTCGASGLCNAVGSCSIYPAGTPCGPSGTTTCDGESVKGQTCDGLGTCSLDTTGTPCTPGRCIDGACKTTCVLDTDCAVDAYCTGGSCKKRIVAGGKCAVDAQCGSGFCSDGVCCNARCDRACEACDQAGTAGTCTAVTGKPRLGHPACAAGESGNPCSASACDGAERASCAKKAGAEVSCRKSSCDAGIETLAATCDGSGTCPASETRPCQPFACGVDACKKSCATAADCKSGFVCNVASGLCTAADNCVGTVVTRVDGTTVECAPYVCESSGRCKSSCATTADCAPGKACNGSTCVDVAQTEVPAEESGGGCAVGPRGVRSGALALLLTALAGALRRRRRQHSA